MPAKWEDNDKLVRSRHLLVRSYFSASILGSVLSEERLGVGRKGRKERGENERECTHKVGEQENCGPPSFQQLRTSQ